MTARLLAGLLLLASLVALGACAPKPPPEDRLVLRGIAFADLPGWPEDSHAAALPALQRSCAALARLPADRAVGPDARFGTAGDWRAPCAAAETLDPDDDAAARLFFESYFAPHLTLNNDEANGLFTGYFEIELRGDRRRDPRFATPLLRRPEDLVSVDLGAFRPAWRGERIAGRVVNGALRPYPTRAEIEDGALAAEGLALAWVEDPVEAFFLHIQGSGRVVTPDGEVVRVGYDGQNGHPYVAIGRLLVERHALTREEASMQGIVAWIRAHPEDGRTLMRENPSYVFFRELKGEGPVGAHGVALTAGRSLAVDRRFLPLGAPMWLDLAEPEGGALRRLVVAQDVGGAIRGPVRGDLFWGHGAEAAQRAGAMRSRGRAFILLPRVLAPSAALPGRPLSSAPGAAILAAPATAPSAS